MDYQNGDKYDGDWKDNRIQGSGVFYFLDGSSYDGEWINGKRNGRGTYVTISNEKYLGEWKNNLKEGEGTYTYSMEVSIRAIGKMIKEMAVELLLMN